MSTFGKQVEVKEGKGFTMHTGAANFNIVAINPTKEELEKMYGRELNFTPEYIGKTKVSDSDGEREVDQIRLDFFLENKENGITTKIQFYVAKTHHKSQTGKLKVINIFGKDSWLEQEAIDSGVMPANMQWYSPNGVKVAYRGEAEVIAMLINLLNLPWDVSKQPNEADCYAAISKNDWDAIIGGNVQVLRNIILDTNNKLGVLLGVKTNGEGKQSQAVFNRHTMRQYSVPGKKFTYLLKDLDEAKANGACGNIDFGPRDCELREYVKTPSTVTSNSINQEDLFNDTPATGMEADTEDWMMD